MHFLCIKNKRMDYIKSSNRSQIEMYNLDDQIEKDKTV